MIKMKRFGDYWPTLDMFGKKGLLPIKIGSMGESVKYLQTLLIKLGYDLSPYGADGNFGEVTEFAVTEFQYNNGLDIDGIVGAKTWTKLESLASVTPTTPGISIESCPEGYTYDSIKQTCVSVVSPNVTINPSTTTIQIPTCPEGYTYDVLKQMCIAPTQSKVMEYLLIGGGALTLITIIMIMTKKKQK